jgi:LPXTG-motif cell wall-anchored protein
VEEAAPVLLAAPVSTVKTYTENNRSFERSVIQWLLDQYAAETSSQKTVYGYFHRTGTVSKILNSTGANYGVPITAQMADAGIISGEQILYWQIDASSADKVVVTCAVTAGDNALRCTADRDLSETVYVRGSVVITDESDASASSAIGKLESFTPAEETVCFFLSLDGTVFDTTDSVASRPVAKFSGKLAAAVLSGLSDTHGYTLAGASDNVAATDAAIRAQTFFTVSAFPADSDIFAAIQNDGKAQKYFGTTCANLTADNYQICWYVVKHENDGWHIDGALVKKTVTPAKYGVSYAYVSGTEGMDLPAALASVSGTDAAYPIADNRLFAAGEAVSFDSGRVPANGTAYEVVSGGKTVGTWTLAWTATADQTMTADGVTFVGTWTYAAAAETPHSADPTTPATDPTTPATDPVTPAADPTTPAADPTTPATDPATPATDPTTPATDPTTPATDPTTPATDPTTPADTNDDEDDDTAVINTPTPAAALPAETEISETSVPQSADPAVQTADQDVQIPETDAPKAEVPQTGDASALYLALAGISGAALLALRKRRNAD